MDPKRKKHDKQYRKKHKEKIQQYHKQYYEQHKKEIGQHHKDNATKIKQYNKQYYEEHKEKIQEYQKQWREDHRKEINQYSREYRKEYEKNRLETDPKFKLRKTISNSVRKGLKKRLSSKKGKATFDFLPYTINELKQHLEKQFEPWMNWNNWGSGKGCWQIDHIKPDAVFNYRDVVDKEFKDCWALTNLQPFDAIENIKKGASFYCK